MVAGGATFSAVVQCTLDGMRHLNALTAIVLAAATGFCATLTDQTATTTIGGKTIAIAYSAPAVNGREGKLFTKDGKIGSDPTYPVWRAGANAATLLTTDADLTIGTLSVPKGKYSLYVNIADPAHWELIVNKQTGQGGTDYDVKQDLGRIKMTMAKPAAMVEQLKYTLANSSGEKCTLTLAWENVTASVPVTVK